MPLGTQKLVLFTFKYFASELEKGRKAKEKNKILEIDLRPHFIITLLPQISCFNEKGISKGQISRYKNKLIPTIWQQETKRRTLQTQSGRTKKSSFALCYIFL